MGRTVVDASLSTRKARSELKARGKPYYRLIDPGLHLGYRKLRGGAGRWVVRLYAGNQAYEVETIATADDLSESNEADVLNFGQAQVKARAMRDERSRTAAGITGPYTVNNAADDYLAFLEHEGRDGAVMDAAYRIDAFIRPTLGSLEVAALTSKQLRGWLAHLAKQSPRVRTKKGEKKQQHRKISDSEDAVRQRRAAANRTLTTLKAMLNHAFDEERVQSNKAWGRRVKPFEGTDAARKGYLQVAEAQRLVNACDPDFRMLVQAALQTGARYGQLANLKAADFNPDTGTVDFRSKKGGKDKSFSCVLSNEGIRFFKQVCAGRSGRDLIFRKANGEPWGKGHQTRPMAEACERARIKPAIGIHQLRHTWATLALMNGTPRIVVAKNMGHSDTRMIDRHYGHIKETWFADAISAGAPTFGFKPDRKVVALSKARA